MIFAGEHNVIRKVMRELNSFTYTVYKLYTEYGSGNGFFVPQPVRD